MLAHPGGGISQLVGAIAPETSTVGVLPFTVNAVTGRLPHSWFGLLEGFDDPVKNRTRLPHRCFVARSGETVTRHRSPHGGIGGFEDPGAGRARGGGGRGVYWLRPDGRDTLVVAPDDELLQRLFGGLEVVMRHFGVRAKHALAALSFGVESNEVPSFLPEPELVEVEHKTIVEHDDIPSVRLP